MRIAKKRRLGITPKTALFCCGSERTLHGETAAEEIGVRPIPVWWRWGRIELPSESISTGTSPGADGHLHSLARAQTVTLTGLVASLYMVRSKLCALTFTTNRRPVPSRGPPGRDGSLIKQREEQYYRCSLIYKGCPFYRMSGASARYSGLHAPVETSASPYKRRFCIAAGKLNQISTFSGSGYSTPKVSTVTFFMTCESSWACPL